MGFIDLFHKSRPNRHLDITTRHRIFLEPSTSLTHPLLSSPAQKSLTLPSPGFLVRVLNSSFQNPRSLSLPASAHSQDIRFNLIEEMTSTAAQINALGAAHLSTGKCSKTVFLGQGLNNSVFFGLPKSAFFKLKKSNDRFGRGCTAVPLRITAEKVLLL